jgi:signal transduction histidine kinase
MTDVAPTDRKLSEAWIGALRPQVARLRGWWQGLSLARQFALAASLVVLVGTLATGLWVADRIKAGVAQSSAASVALYMDNVIVPRAQELAREGRLTAAHEAELDQILAPLVGRKVSSVKIWLLDGTVIYSTRKEIVGRRFPLTPNFLRARSGSIAAEFEGRPHEGDAHDRSLRALLLEIYAPVHEIGTDRVIAVAEIYAIREGMAAELRQAALMSWLVVASIGGAMMATLSGIVFRGSRTIVEQDRQLREQIDELKYLLAQNDDLRQHLERARQRSATLNERILRRVGADLHDGPAQLIGLSLLMLDSPAPAAAPGEGQPVSARVRATLSDALREIRAISSGLAMPEVAAAGLDEIAKQVVKAHERHTGSVVALTPAGRDAKVPMPLKVCIYRFLQEGLSNAYRHAGGKGQAVAVQTNGGTITIKVSDHGPGLMEAQSVGLDGGLGLIGLRDRIETLGGTLTVVSGSTGCALEASFDLASAQRIANGIE